MTPLKESLLLHSGLILYSASVAVLFAAVGRASPRLLTPGRAAAAAAAACHGLLLALRGHFPAATLFEFALLLSAGLMATGLALDLVRRMPIFTVGCAPTALAFAIVAALVGAPAGPRPEKVLTATAVAHVLVMLAAFGAFALAFVGGLLYLFEQRKLKARPGAPLLGFLPPLEALYRLMRACVGIGVGLLTAGVLVGYLYARRVETLAGWRTDPKVLLTTATWLAYLLVGIGSLVPPLRGRRTALASVVSFALVILAFWASAFWSPFHNFR